MEYLKLYEEFLNESERNYMLLWQKAVDGYSESTGCFVDNNFKVIDTIDPVFGPDGEFTQDVLDKKKKHNVKSAEFVSVKKNKREVPTEVITPTEAAKRFKADVDQVDKINKFMAPEKEQELLNLFKKKNEELSEGKVADKIDEIIQKNKAKAKEFFKNLKKEIDQTKEAKDALIKSAKGEELSDDEIQLIRTQSKDIIKALGIGTVFVLPGGSLLLPFLLNLASKVGVDLIPSAFAK